MELEKILENSINTNSALLNLLGIEEIEFDSLLEETKINTEYTPEVEKASFLNYNFATEDPVLGDIDLLEFQRYLEENDLTPYQIGEVIWELQKDWYSEPLVSIEQFATDPFFLGNTLTKGNYPLWHNANQLLYPHPCFSPYFEVIAETAIGSGKCCAKNTKIVTSNGIKNIQDIIPGEFVQSDSGLKKVNFLFNNGLKKLKKIQLHSGKILKVTDQHKFKVLSENGLISYKKIQDIKENDYFITQLKEHILSKYKLEKGLAYFLGLLSGDGSITATAKNLPRKVIGFHMGHKTYETEPLFVNEVTQLFHKFVGEALFNSRPGVYSIIKNNLKFGEYLLEQQFYESKDIYLKRVPQCVFKACKEDILEYLAGLIDTDGHCSKNEFSISFKDRIFAEQVQILFSGLGVNTRIKDKLVKKYNKDYYILYIKGHESRNNLKALNLRISYKKEHFNNYINQEYSRNIRTRIPYLKEYLRLVLRKILNKYKISQQDENLFGLYHNKNNQIITLEVLKKLKEKYKEDFSTETTNYLIKNNVYLDKILKIEDIEDETYDIEVEGDHSYLINGLVSHNSLWAAEDILYELYRMSRLDRPQEFYGLLKNTMIAFMVMSQDLGTAGDVNWSNIEGFISDSPCFQEIVTLPRGNKAPEEIYFPNKIQLKFASKPSHFTGRAVFGGICDEVNVGRYIRQIYKDIVKRMNSRFPLSKHGGIIPGKLFLLSSPKDAGSFLAERIDNKKQFTLVINNIPIWQIRDPGPADLNLCGKVFPMFIGTELKDPFIVKAGMQLTDEILDNIIEVPEEYYDFFELDPVDSLREFAGLRTANQGKLFPSTKPIELVFNKPNVCDLEVIELNFDDPEDKIINYFKDKKIFSDPVDPEAKRFIHIDNGIANDKCGVGCYHAVEKTIEYTDKDTGQIRSKVIRFYKEDFKFALKKPQNEEVCIPKLIDFLIDLKENYKFPISKLSTDKFEGAVLRQFMRLHQIETVHLSIDKDKEVWKFVRAVIILKQIEGQYNSLFIRECGDLEDTGKTYDHPAIGADGKKGSHDLTQGAFGAIYLCGTSPSINTAAGLIKEFHKKTILKYSESSLKGKILNNYNKHKKSKFLSHFISDINMDF